MKLTISGIEKTVGRKLAEDWYIQNVRWGPVAYCWDVVNVKSKEERNIILERFPNCEGEWPFVHTGKYAGVELSISKTILRNMTATLTMLSNSLYFAEKVFNN